MLFTTIALHILIVMLDVRLLQIIYFFIYYMARRKYCGRVLAGYICRSFNEAAHSFIRFKSPCLAICCDLWRSILCAHVQYVVTLVLKLNYLLISPSAPMHAGSVLGYMHC